MAEKKNIVTIDGPSGAGKSTISKLLAARLRYTYLDTGAMYRVVGLQVLRGGLDLEDQGAREKLAPLLAALDMTLAPGEEGKETRAFLDGEDVSAAIRTPEMAMVASRVSAQAEVRKKLTALLAIMEQLLPKGVIWGPLCSRTLCTSFFWMQVQWRGLNAARNNSQKMAGR
jgi:cytidylate kinase